MPKTVYEVFVLIKVNRGRSFKRVLFDTYYSLTETEEVLKELEQLNPELIFTTDTKEIVQNDV